MPGPKPEYKKGKMVVSKMALPGAPAGTAMVVEKVLRGGKREGFRHQYKCKDNNNQIYYIYENYLG